MRNCSRAHSHRGFSIFEALIVLGLIAIMAAVFIPIFLSVLQAYRAETTAQQFQINLRFARAAAVKQKVSYKVLFSDEGESPANTYKIEYDPDRNGSYEKFTRLDTDLPEGTTIVSGSLNEVEFDSRGSAELTPVSTPIRIRAVEGTVYRVTVSTIGAVTITKE